MWERIKFIMGSLGDFLWPLIKQFLTSAAPVVKAAAMAAVAATASKYASQIVDNNTKHNDAYGMIVNELARQGLQIGQDFTESMIDTAIAAAVKQLK